jgi:small-conductance mechanosensitive channel
LATLTGWLQHTLGIPPHVQSRLLTSLIVVAALWIVRRLFMKLLWRRVSEPRSRYRIRKMSLYVAVTVGALIVGRVWFEGIQSLATFLGLLTAGLAIALKDLVVNFAGWAFILWRKPLEVGDRIQIGEHRGDVIDLRVFQFTLLEIGNWVDAEQSTGRIIHIPNGKVLSEVLANYTKGFQYIWDEIPVMVTFESDWKKAKLMLSEIVERYGHRVAEAASQSVQQANQKFLISYTKLTPTVYTSVVDSGVLLTLRYLCSPRERRAAAHQIWEAILEAFERCDDIDFAYPTQRFYDNAAEGKPAARSDSPRGPE